MFVPKHALSYSREELLIPEGLVDSKWEYLPSKPCTVVKEFVKNWATVPEGVAPIFVGPAATGKTRSAAVLAIWAYNRLRVPHRYREEKKDREMPVNVVWVDWRTLTRVQDRQRCGFEEAQNVQHDLTRWAKAGLLIIDEFQLSPPERVADLIWGRTEANLPTILTGNVEKPSSTTISSLFGSFGPGLEHRLQRMTHEGRWLVNTEDYGQQTTVPDVQDLEDLIDLSPKPIENRCFRF